MNESSVMVFEKYLAAVIINSTPQLSNDSSSNCAKGGNNAKNSSCSRKILCTAHSVPDDGTYFFRWRLTSIVHYSSTRFGYCSTIDRFGQKRAKNTSSCTTSPSQVGLLSASKWQGSRWRRRRRKIAHSAHWPVQSTTMPERSHTKKS